MDFLGRWISEFMFGGFSKWSLWLFMSHSVSIWTRDWALLNMAWQTIFQRAIIFSPITNHCLWQSSSFSRLLCVRDGLPSPPRGKHKILHLKPSTQFSLWLRETLLPFLTFVDTTNRLALSLFTPVTASSQRDTACFYRPVKYPPKISQIHSFFKFPLFWIDSLWFQLLTYILHSMEL